MNGIIGTINTDLQCTLDGLESANPDFWIVENFSIFPKFYILNYSILIILDLFIGDSI